MTKEVISDKQGISLVILFIMGSTLVLGTGAEAGKDSWLAILVAAAFACPVVLMYSRLLALSPGKDLFYISEWVLGRMLGKGIGLLYIWFAFHLGALVIRNFGEFINTISLPETPKIIPMTGLVLLCLWAVKSGIEVLGRWGELGLIVLLILIFLTIGLLVPKMDWRNIQPFLQKGFKPIGKGALAVFSFPFAETVVFAGVFSVLQRKNSIYRVYLWGLLLGAAIVWATAFTEILVLGEGEYTTILFPAHSTVRRINIRNFIQRLEIIPAIAFLGGGFIKVSICLFSACYGIARVCNYEDYRIVASPVALLMLNLSHWIYDSTMEMFDWAFQVWPYYAFFFQVILPAILLVAGEIKNRQGKGAGKNYDG
ncbi:GerAB/ArcD/ProY family transporter [Thermotalea metallivorans]|uniref:Spore germination protein YndE n=1 Tax=Thermotalea metallivorans TaxID=520762 RepID=A0A140L2G0_9FIRM|nr:endospore germination permease [Thermotalea metallivorans]KXG74735.1 Spore germination protein YndE [Thermotalea metallivorans]